VAVDQVTSVACQGLDQRLIVAGDGLMRVALMLYFVSALLAACGDKVPESQAAKQIGSAPKQIIEQATSDVGKSLDQGSDRSRQSEEGK